MPSSEDIIGYISYKVVIKAGGNSWSPLIPVTSMEQADLVAKARLKPLSPATEHRDIRLISPGKRKVLKDYSLEWAREQKHAHLLTKNNQPNSQLKNKLKNQKRKSKGRKL